MLNIISDLHLTDETAARNVNARAFTKYYKPTVIREAQSNKARELKIILLGDIFDFVRTDYWQKVSHDERPWNGILDKETAMNSRSVKILEHYRKALRLILENENTSAFISTLNEIALEVGNDSELGGIPVSVHYVVGNHDRAFHCFPELQEMFRNVLTEYSPTSVTFGYRFSDLDNYSAICRHGHEYDANNYGKDFYCDLNGIDREEINRFDARLYKVQTIGEVITAELMSGIIYRLRGTATGKKLVDSMMDINNVRPMKDSLFWLCWYCRDMLKRDKNAMVKAFKESLQATLDTTLAKKWDETQREFWLFNMDITDQFEKILKVVDQKTFDEVVELVNVLGSFFGGESEEDPYFEEAKKVFRSPANDKAQFVLFGHTHDYCEKRVMGYPDGKIQTYINTGTFLPYIQKISAGGPDSFASSIKMTMVNIFRRDEDTDIPEGNSYPTLTLWDGTKYEGV